MYAGQTANLTFASKHLNKQAGSCHRAIYYHSNPWAGPTPPQSLGSMWPSLVDRTQLCWVNGQFLSLAFEDELGEGLGGRTSSP